MKKIIIQGKGRLLKAALMEDSELLEVFEEEGDHSRLVGNIYRGRVENVLPGMQAAFVDIGLEKNAFLYVTDALPHRFIEDEDKRALEEEVRIDQILQPRQELLVQVVKEPVGTKGPRVTTHLSLPGRYSVLMPLVDYVGVSRKITEYGERERLRKLAGEACPKGMGIIVRTLGEGAELVDLQEDMESLKELWNKIRRKAERTSIPGLVHQDADLVTRLVRDFIDQDIERIIVDQEDTAVNLQAALQEIGHRAALNVRIESGDLFTKYEIDDEVRKALRPKVWLNSGGYLVINPTEALIVIDVNTGKYVGEHSLEKTILRTNLEAAREIAHQLRLRNLGGIIVIDFIDMTEEDDRKAVLGALEQACAHDKTKCQILGLTRLGLVEMTRKKTGQPLWVRYAQRCPQCEGIGIII